MSDKMINRIVDIEEEAKSRIKAAKEESTELVAEAQALDAKLQRSIINKRKEVIKEEISDYSKKSNNLKNEYEESIKIKYNKDITESDYLALAKEMVAVICKGSSSGKH